VLHSLSFVVFAQIISSSLRADTYDWAAQLAGCLATLLAVPVHFATFETFVLFQGIWFMYKGF